MRQKWSHEATPDAVSRLRRQISDFAGAAGVPDPPLADVKLAVSEAVTNAVVHSYRDDPHPGVVEIVASYSPKELRIIVCDQGLGLQPRVDSPGIGLGLPLIAQLADSYELRGRKPHGTEVHMHFRIPEAA